jgi:glutathione S-transferase
MSLDFDIQTITLTNMPQDMVAMYRNASIDDSVSAKVPLFRDANQDLTLIESAIITEYICDRYGPTYLTAVEAPATTCRLSPEELGKARMFIHLYEKHLSGMSMRIVRTNDEELDKLRAQSREGQPLYQDLVKGCKVLDTYIQRCQKQAGSYLLGRMTIAEFMTAPFIVRLVPWLKHMCDIDLEAVMESEHCDALSRWLKDLLSRSTVIAATPSKDEIIENFLEKRNKIFNVNCASKTSKP